VSTVPVAPPVAPSRAAIAKATAIALVVAVIILVVAVLPAEYGIDPLGTGRALGLTNLYSTGRGTATAADTSGNPAPASAASLNAGATSILQNTPFHEQTIELTLGAFGFIEHKYKLEKGASMIYSWSATGPVMYDLHTEPEGKPPEASESFAMGKGTSGSGSYTAPYSGLHGWYFENLNEMQSIKLTIKAVGFFDQYRQYYDDETHKDFKITGKAEGEEISGTSTK
jgi:hypothetical protein